MMLTN